MEINIQACAYLTQQPEIKTVADLSALMSAVGIHSPVHSNFPVFGEVFLKLKKFCQPYDKFNKPR
jgi:hypothetical protein